MAADDRRRREIHTRGSNSGLGRDDEPQPPFVFCISFLINKLLCSITSTSSYSPDTTVPLSDTDSLLLSCRVRLLNEIRLTKTNTPSYWRLASPVMTKISQGLCPPQIWRHTSTSLGRHAVKLIGWGRGTSDAGEDYWVCFVDLHIYSYYYYVHCQTMRLPIP